MEVVNSRFEVQQFFYSYQTSSGAYNNPTYTAVASQQHMCVPVFYIWECRYKKHSTCLFNTNWSNFESKSSPSSAIVVSFICWTATDTLLVVLCCSDLCAFPDISEDKRTSHASSELLCTCTKSTVVAIKSWLNMFLIYRVSCVGVKRLKHLHDIHNLTTCQSGLTHLSHSL